MTQAHSPRVLIVDDDPYVGEMLRDFLAAADLQPTWMDQPQAGLVEAASGKHDVILLDLMMPGMDGLTFLKKIKEVQPSVEVIMLTARQEMTLLDRALKLKAFDYLVKPTPLQKLVATIRSAMTCRLQKIGVPASPLPIGTLDHGWLVAGPESARLSAWARACAPYCATALITGPVGSGTALLAQVLHGASGRPADKLVRLDLAQVEQPAQEAELLGGVLQWKRLPKVGALKRADGGTLVLENVERLTPGLQRRLVLLLDTGQLDDPPSMDEDFLDVKIVALSHRDLAERSAGDAFAPDLLRKLSLVSAAIPPLASRRIEIPTLARHFLTQAGEAAGKAFTGFTPEAEQVLSARPWPGDVAELEAAMGELARRASGPVVDAGALS